MTSPLPGRGPRLPLRAWLLLSHLLVLALPLVVLVGSGALATDLREQTRQELRQQAGLLALLAEVELGRAREARPGVGLAEVGEALDPYLERAREATLASVRLVDAGGVVVASSGLQRGENLLHRLEVAEALEGATADVLRPRTRARHGQPLASQSRRATVRLFLAHPVVVEGQVVGAVVLARTPREEVQALYHLVPRWGAALALLATVLVALGSGHLFGRSLDRLLLASRRIAEGRLQHGEALARSERSRVTEVGALAQSVAAMAARLRGRLAYISEFAGNVSHEFKTPLSTLRGTVELLSDDEQMPTEQRARFLRNAQAELDRLDRMVSGLLALARAEEGTADAVVDLQRCLLEAARRHPGLVVEGRAAAVRGSAAQLEAVLDNLVHNARRHGGEGVQVRVVGFCEAGHTGFEVVDDGRGISEANLPRVFDRFFTTDRQGGGTGLGLALVRAICEAQGGTVEIESRPGHTRVRVALPQATEAAGGLG